VEICFAPEDQKDRLIRSIREDYVRGTCASTDVTLRTPAQGRVGNKKLQKNHLKKPLYVFLGFLNFFFGK
jgi:hypothetical protein